MWHKGIFILQEVIPRLTTMLSVLIGKKLHLHLHGPQLSSYQIYKALLNYASLASIVDMYNVHMTRANLLLYSKMPLKQMGQVFPTYDI